MCSHTVLTAFHRGSARAALAVVIAVCVSALVPGESPAGGGIVRFANAASVSITARGGRGGGPDFEHLAEEGARVTGRYIRDGNIECLTYSDGSEMCANIPPGETESMAGRSARTGSAVIHVDGDEVVRLL